MAVKIGKAVVASRARTVKAGAVPARPSRPAWPWQGTRPSWRARTVMFRHPIQWFMVRHMGYTPKQAKKGLSASRIRSLFTPQTEAVRKQLPHLFKK